MAFITFYTSSSNGQVVNYTTSKPSTLPIFIFLRKTFSSFLLFIPALSLKINGAAMLQCRFPLKMQGAALKMRLIPLKMRGLSLKMSGSPSKMNSASYKISASSYKMRGIPIKMRASFFLLKYSPLIVHIYSKLFIVNHLNK